MTDNPEITLLPIVGQRNQRGQSYFTIGGVLIGYIVKGKFDDYAQVESYVAVVNTVTAYRLCDFQIGAVWDSYRWIGANGVVIDTDSGYHLFESESQAKDKLMTVFKDMGLDRLSEKFTPIEASIPVRAPINGQ